MATESHLPVVAAEPGKATDAVERVALPGNAEASYSSSWSDRSSTGTPASLTACCCLSLDTARCQSPTLTR
eukprot:CAMPEP_0202872042 /NCGR_PEP_ID=MMETSP1391-20130828/20259_1 /ASSEMBLY_ACC=CAM_ASM_000867 /TAXON_ID=1034604 /ORGANISM="Chlamydomonas leiostraca, Strain SAG 11-49" /LENGTH=70 /DNA_ID=CAMNT_0049552989 /DNA_START=164 /DNA_END=376 /DNA_ORIENTATION=-